jgi:hypothetical protein
MGSQAEVISPAPRKSPAARALAAAAVAAVGVGFAAGFTHVAPRTHFLKADLAWQIANAKKHGGLPKGGALALNPGEASFRSHLTSLRDGLETVARHPQGFGLGNAGTTAARFDVSLKAGESNYTEIGVETGLAGLLLFVGWNLALLAGLVRNGRHGDGRAALVAAALAAVLLLGVQTDAYGIPWLGVCLWWLAAASLSPRGAARAAPGTPS